MAISAKAITISTAGVVPMIRRFTAEGHRFRLIVSLGAPTSEERLALMPIERRWPLPELMEAMRAHAAAAGGRVTLAYVGDRRAQRDPRPTPASWSPCIGDLRVKMNLIDVSDETGQYPPPTEEEIAAFRDELSTGRHPGRAPLLGRPRHRRRLWHAVRQPEGRPARLAPLTSRRHCCRGSDGSRSRLERSHHGGVVVEWSAIPLGIWGLIAEEGAGWRFQVESRSSGSPLREAGGGAGVSVCPERR